MKYAYLDWLTSIKDPILEVVNEMCSSPMTISSSYKAQRRAIMIRSITNPMVTRARVKNTKIQAKIYIPTNLSPDSVWRRPQGIVFFCDLTVINDSLQLFHHAFMNISLKEGKYLISLLTSNCMYVTSSRSWLYLFSDHDVVLVVTVVCISQFAWMKTKWSIKIIWKLLMRIFNSHWIIIS